MTVEHLKVNALFEEWKHFKISNFNKSSLFLFHFKKAEMGIASPPFPSKSKRVHGND